MKFIFTLLFFISLFKTFLFLLFLVENNLCNRQSTFMCSYAQSQSHPLTFERCRWVQMSGILRICHQWVGTLLLELEILEVFCNMGSMLRKWSGTRVTVWAKAQKVKWYAVYEERIEWGQEFRWFLLNRNWSTLNKSKEIKFLCIEEQIETKFGWDDGVTVGKILSQLPYSVAWETVVAKQLILELHQMKNSLFLFF